MRGIVVGDAHFCDKIPVKRKDDFFNAQLRKIDKLKTIIDETHPDALFLLGDVFDRHSPNIWLVNEIMRKLKELKIEIYAIVGNHCVHGRVDGVDDVGLGTLFGSGTIQRLEENSDFYGIPVRGLDYSTNHSVDMYRTNVPRLMFTHNMIVPRKVIFDHILAKDVAAVANGSLIFAGHYHPPFVFKSMNATIVNPGVLVRTDVSEKVIDPSVILFDVTLTNKKLDFNFKSLSLGAELGEEVFDVARHEKEKAKELDLRNFIDKLKNTQFQSQDIEAMIIELGKEKNVEAKAITEAVARIRSAKANV